MEPLISVLRKKKKIVIIAGAGISVSAGIPCFNQMTQKEKNNLRRPALGTPEFIAFMYRLHSLSTSAKPTIFHHFVATLAYEGRLLRLYTQNIDGLELKLEPLKTNVPLEEKGPWPNTIQLHGCLNKLIGADSVCSHLFDFDAKLFSGDSLQSCPKCAEIAEERRISGKTPRGVAALRPRIKLYNEDHIETWDIDAISKVVQADVKAKPDAVIVIGTRLSVQSGMNIAKSLCSVSKFTAWINPNPPPKLGIDWDVEIQCTSDALVNFASISPWWLRKVPRNLDSIEMVELEKWCGIFVSGTEVALRKALVDVDDHTLYRALVEKDIRRRISEIKLLEDFQFSDSILCGKVPILPDPWEKEAYRILGLPTPLVSQIIKLPRTSIDITPSLWRLRPAEELNDEIINAYLLLLQQNASNGQIFHHSFWNSKRLPRKHKLHLSVGDRLFVPIHHPPPSPRNDKGKQREEQGHWGFAVLQKDEIDKIHTVYYDSLERPIPGEFCAWAERTFPGTLTYQNPIQNPKQTTTNDCGVFVLLGIRLIAFGNCLPQSYEPQLLASMRVRILAELLVSHINPLGVEYQAFKLREKSAQVTQLQETTVSDLSVAQAESSFEDRVQDSDSSLSSVSEWRFTTGINPHTQGTTAKPQNLASREKSTCQTRPKEVDPKQSSGSSQKRPTYKKNIPEILGHKFGDKTLMLGVLEEAVTMKRIAAELPEEMRGIDLKYEGIDLENLWRLVRYQKGALHLRQVHYEFARAFWTEVMNLSSHTYTYTHRRIPKKLLQMIKERNASLRVHWETVLQQARRFSIWLELSDIFNAELGQQNSVVLCAVSGVTSAIEAMTSQERKNFLEIIRCRTKADPTIAARLQAALSLYRSLMYGDLPTYKLCIETPHQELPFTELVSLEEQKE